MALQLNRKRSSIWTFFTTAENTKFATCSVCLKEVPRGGQSTKSYTTTNLINHLKSKHPEEYKNYEELKVTKEKETNSKDRQSSGNEAKLKQVTLPEARDLLKPWDINDHRAKSIHIKIAEMIALDCQPYSLVEDVGFKALVRALEPKYQIPSRRYFCETVIPEMVCTMESRIKSKLEGMQYVSFTTDVWSSDVNSDSLLSLTAHWIDDSFNPLSAVLQAESLEERHTGEYIGMKISKMMSEWGIETSQVHCVIRDNGSNIVKAMSEAGLPSFGCFAHSLQLIVHEGLLTQRVVIDLLAVCRSIVGHFKHSSVACHKLARIQENLGLPQHTLKQDVSTRWNSTLYMIQSILEQKMALAAYAAENDIPQLTANQLEIARKLTLVLAPIEEITQAISKQTATLSMVIPFVRVLLRSWEKEDDRGIQTMKEQMIHSLNLRFAGIEDNQLLSVATLTDPRFKDRFFGSNIVKASAKDMLQEELRKESPPSESSVDGVDRTKAPSPKRHKNNSLLEVFSDIIDTSSAETASPMNEVDCYLMEPLLNYKESQPFAWWADHKSRYPTVAQVAKRYLSATATSVPSETLFSAAGNVYDDRRNRITAEHAQHLLFIKSNYSLFGKK